MYKKILIILTLGLTISGCGAGVSDYCTSTYDSVRTSQQNYNCLLNYRLAYQELESDIQFVLQNPELILGQPVNPNIIFQPVNPNIFYTQPVNPN